MNKYKGIVACCCLIFAFTHCKKDNVEYRYPKPYAGTTVPVALPGLAGTELGKNAANSVFVDFSTGVISTASRLGWDLGFYPGPEFKVILNHSLGATAFKTTKTDLTAVGAADSTNLVNTLQLGTAASAGMIDPVVGDSAAYVSGLLIQDKDIAATEAESFVYLVNPGISGVTGVLNTTTNVTDPPIRPWYKMKIYRGTNGYVVKSGKLTETQFNPVPVNKNPSFNFNFFSFTNANASAEPAKSLWDIEWTLTTYKDNTGIPVAMPDFVLINFVGGVKAAQVMIVQTTDPSTTVTYENFVAANLSSIPSYSGNRDAIGINWRTINGAGQTVVNNDRFYVIKDAIGNYYKLRFNSSSNYDGGTRGRPVIEFKLVQAAPNPII